MQPRAKWPGFLQRLLMAGFIAVVLTKTAGGLYFEPRPFVTQHFQPLIAHAPDNGFPSDHTVVSTLAALLCLGFNRTLGCGLLLLALLVGATRVLCGLHTPLDVVAAMAIAAVSVLAAQAAVRLKI